MTPKELQRVASFFWTSFWAALLAWGLPGIGFLATGLAWQKRHLPAFREQKTKIEINRAHWVIRIGLMLGTEPPRNPAGENLFSATYTLPMSAQQPYHLATGPRSKIAGVHP
jgi:hypothetical protein